MRYTIESRPLARSGFPQSPLYPIQITVEASSAHEAVNQFVSDGEATLVSLARPSPRGEAIATVEKQDSLFLVRVSKE